MKCRRLACGPVDYDEILKELMIALGAALFLGNAYALMRRREDREKAKGRAVAKHRPGSPVRGQSKTVNRDLVQAPVARSVTYLAIGFIVMVWGLASRFG
jgi:hypothetical protein